MDFFSRIVEQFIRANRKLRRWQRAVSLLSAVVVFVTTYALVLPAITLDKDTAQQQSGIEVAASEANIEKSGAAVADAEPEEEPVEEAAESEGTAGEPEDNGGGEESEYVEVTEPAETVEEEPGQNEDSEPKENGGEEPEYINDEEPEYSGEGATLSDENNGHYNESKSNDGENSAASSDAPVNGTTETHAEDILANEILSVDDLEAAIAAGEIELITEKTQLVYEYIDEEYEKYKEENKDKEADEDSEEEIDDGYFVYAEFDVSAKLPIGVELRVREITKESDPEEYAVYCEKTLAEMQNKYDENTGITFARFYDISFVYQGLEIEPSGDVRIRIEYKREIDVRQDENIDTIHFNKGDEENPEVIKSEINPDEKENSRKKDDEENDPVKAVEFTSDQFSVYGVVGTGSITTTFLSVDGNTYEVTINCDTDANIPAGSELVVSEVESTNDKYEEYLANAAEAMDVSADKIAYAKLLDISIVKDGEEVTPEKPVDVQIKLLDRESFDENESLNVIHYESGEENPVLVDGTEQYGVVSFEAEGFSVYGVFYTVDFSWEVDGKTYEFSLPGGGFISFTELVEALGVIDSVKEFVADVEDIEFSTPELVWIGKIGEESTVAQIKEANGIESRYSADLREEDIAEINAQTVEAGDWAIISIRPFTSEESLTVIMENGEQFVIKVTDAQINSIQDGHRYVIYWLDYEDENYYVLKGNGETELLEIDSEGLDHTLNFLGNDYLWTFDYVENHDTWNVYSNQGFYINVDETRAASGSVVSSTPMVTGIQFDCESYGDDWNFWYASATGQDYSTYYLTPDMGLHKMIVDSFGWSDDPEGFFLFDQTERRMNFTVKTEYNNTYRGTVGGKDYTSFIDEPDKGASHNPAYRDHLASFIGVTNKGGDGLTNKDAITAEEGLGYRFKGWRLDEEYIDESCYTSYQQGEKTIYRIDPGVLTFTRDNQILTAVFEKIPNSEGVADYSDLVNNWKQEQVADQLVVDKTAEVYDYDNRIYEVDITASGNARIIQPDVEMIFVTDISRSMYFPSKLQSVATFSTKEEMQRQLNSLRNAHVAETNSSDHDSVYYLLANESSDATIYAVRYDAQGDRRWEIIDASYDVTTHDKTGAPGTGLGQTWDFPLLIDGYYNGNGYTGGGTFNENGKVYINTTNNGSGTNQTRKELKGQIYVASDSVYRLEYLQQAVDIASEVVYTVDDEGRIGLVTFARESGTDDRHGFFTGDEYSNLISALNTIAPTGRTDQLRGLQNAHGMFNDQAELDGSGQPKDKKKVVILITDGAPNNGGSNGNPDLNWNNIKREARSIENDIGATIFAVGLAVDGIKDGNVDVYQRLQETATRPGYAFNARDGIELVQAILDIVDTQITLADIYGTITDTVDPAYYPVTADGTPITPGYYDKDGNPISASEAETLDASLTEYYQWIRTGESWVITWYNVFFEKEKEENGVKSPGTDKKILIKAKEDFLGGNTISTNMGKTKATAIYYRERVDEGQPIPDAVPLAKQLVRQMDTPYVNIDELTINDHETEWTVYLGTNVNPEAQLEAIFKDIKIREVVTLSESQAHQMGIIYANSQVMTYDPEHPDDPERSGQTIYDVESGAWEDDDETLKEVEPSTFTLASVIQTITKRSSSAGQIGGLTQAEWNSLIAGETVTFKYYGDPAYGHGTEDDPVGTIEIQLTKTIAPGEGSIPNAHNTTVTNEEFNDQPVEQYALTVTYTPTPPKAVEYHTGTYVNEEPQPGIAADTMTSNNTHNINVYVKGLQITKVDLNDQILSGAKFALYRTAREGETDLLEINGGQYYKVAELDTSSTGIAVKDQIEQLEAGEQYYLAETEAPPGYNKISPIPVNLDISDVYTPKPGTETQTTKPESGIYNWVQKASLILSAESGVKRTDADNTEDLTHNGTANLPNSNTEIIYYRITNNPGVELPSTGGSGTNLLYLIGITLIGLAGAGLVMKRRRRNTV